MPSRSQPFSLRLPAKTDALVREEARRTKRSKGAIVTALAEEALRCRRFPGIAFRGVDWQRRPWVIGTALDVWEIVRAYRDFGSVVRMVAESDIEEHHVRIALAYAKHHHAEVEEAISQNDLSPAQARESFLSFDVLEV